MTWFADASAEAQERASVVSSNRPIIGIKSYVYLSVIVAQNLDVRQVFSTAYIVGFLVTF